MKISLLLLVSIILMSLADSRKKKKKQKAQKKAEDPLDRRPTKTNPELYCDSCMAMVTESIKELRGKKKESDVITVVENVCDPERYYTYRNNKRNNLSSFFILFRSPSP